MLTQTNHESCTFWLVWGCPSHSSSDQSCWRHKAAQSSTLALGQICEQCVTSSSAAWWAPCSYLRWEENPPCSQAQALQCQATEIIQGHLWPRRPNLFGKAVCYSSHSRAQISPCHSEENVILETEDKNCSPEARLTPAKHSACEGICLQVSRQRKANAISRCAAADPPRPPAARHQRPLQRQREERQQTLLLMPQSHRSPAAPWGCLVGQQDRLCPSAHHPSAAEGQPC